MRLGTVRSHRDPHGGAGRLPHRRCCGTCSRWAARSTSAAMLAEASRSTDVRFGARPDGAALPRLGDRGARDRAQRRHRTPSLATRTAHALHRRRLPHRGRPARLHDVRPGPAAQGLRDGERRLRAPAATPDSAVSRVVATATLQHSTQPENGLPLRPQTRGPVGEGGIGAEPADGVAVGDGQRVGGRAGEVRDDAAPSQLPPVSALRTRTSGTRTSRCGVTTYCSTGFAAPTVVSPTIVARPSAWRS